MPTSLSFAAMSYCALALLFAIGLSLSLACAVPFAALAAVGALLLSRFHAVLFALAVWLINQLVGFGFMNFPYDVPTVAWGIVLGGCTVLAAWAAAWTVSIARQAFSSAIVVLLSFIVASVGFQGMLLVGNVVMLGHLDQFFTADKWGILLTELLSFFAMVGLYQAAVQLRLLPPAVVAE